MNNYVRDSNKKGVYKIFYDNHIYIGSTNTSFKLRLMSHLIGKSTNAQHMLLNMGAKFAVIEDMSNYTEQEIIDREKWYIIYYQNNPSWICENIKNYTSNYQRKPKIKYKHIKIENKYYDKVLQFMKNENIPYHITCNRKGKNNEEAKECTKC